MAQPTPLIILLAETRRFELLKGLTPYLVSSEALIGPGYPISV